nr:MAG TPA: hypothetical protein [Caudoviricetes sp.]
MNTLKKLAPFVIVILILGIVGKMDFDDHVQIERYKCERVNGSWIVEYNGNTQYCK